MLRLIFYTNNKIYKIYVEQNLSISGNNVLLLLAFKHREINKILKH